MEKYAITIKNLNVHTTNFFGIHKTKILKNISFNLPMGKICTFIGHNGAGKTTTVKAILGLKRITRGKIKIFDKDISDISSKQMIGYIPEKGNHEPITVKDFLKSIGRFYRITNREVKIRSEKILEYFDIEKSILNSKLNKLSTGQNKIIMFIQAFISQSKIIIADEPTDNMDPENRDLFWNFINKYYAEHPETTFFVVTHNLDEIEKYTDYVVFIDHGRIKFTSFYNRSAGLRQQYQTLRLKWRKSSKFKKHK